MFIYKFCQSGENKMQVKLNRYRSNIQIYILINVALKDNSKRNLGIPQKQVDRFIEK